MINLNRIAITCLVLSYVFFTSCEKSEDTKIQNTEVISKDITSNLTLENNINGVDYITNSTLSNFLKYGIAYYASKPHNADIETSNSCSGNIGISCFWKR
ncbi:MAG TPA: hypothetical protein PKD32_07495 [Saprospiraceae bacterium]|jgi:hypothetical protein|nr:hypothetical protein [Saprospiraceae bacterium]